MIVTTLPRVTATIRPSKDGRIWVLELTCPFCGRSHSHGGGTTDQPPTLGYRLSHCHDRPAQGYDLIPVTEIEP